MTAWMVDRPAMQRFRNAFFSSLLCLFPPCSTPPNKP
ncbi:hypothetical protein RB6562 [Rhodopirellula baltica SH 1]|uniref:Uncharacterized protein n=1 Tax=Rhodopirellula baltica (strain DSM 10527 / NCIMB 13988 / SH1) TaxID=243090 RepID=Q7UQ26_RHOBA|nr:hypothetical protein RB6562 [Rhodopirellula baltica SH 1]